MITAMDTMAPAKKRSIWRIVGLLIYFGIYGLAGFSIGLTRSMMEGLPPVSALEEYAPSLPTELYDIKGRLITNYYIERRYVVPLEKIPQALRDAVISTEDEYFYQHFGINPLAFVRAAIINLRAGGIRQGGSTLTMQLARNLFLTQDRTLTRKLEEIVLSLQIEQSYSKDEILQFYFNQMNYGEGCYGAEAASRVYFGKPVDQLDLAQCSALAGIPQAPGAYSPYRNPEGAIKRRNTVLSRMLITGKISRADFDAVKTQDIQPVPMEYAQDRAPYFTEYVRRQLEREYGASGLYRSGLKVYTTLDLDVQEIANESMTWGLDWLEKAKSRYRPKKMDEKLTLDKMERGQVRFGRVESMNKSYATVYLGNNIRGTIDISPAHWGFRKKANETFGVGDEITVKVLSMNRVTGSIELSYELPPYIQGALVCMDTHSGEIRAMVGGYDFRESPFNRAYQSKRQPGSSFKVFLYTAAFDNGFSPGDVFMDSPFEINALGIHWRPHNYSRSFSNAPMTIRRAVALSINIVAARLVDQVGVETLIDYAHRMGIKSELPAVYSLALGAGDVTVLEMTNAFATLPNGGIHVEPTAIRKILDRNGNILADNSTPITSVAVPPETAAIMINVMEDTMSGGTASAARSVYGFKHAAAGKTGTTDNAADTWFIGFIPDLVAGVWVGCDDHSTLGAGAHGEGFAVPIWSHFMKQVVEKEGIPNKKFEIPPGVMTATVCEESGLLATARCTRARSEMFGKGAVPDKFCDLHGATDFYRKSLELERGSETGSSLKATPSSPGVVPTVPPVAPN